MARTNTIYVYGHKRVEKRNSKSRLSKGTVQSQMLEAPKAAACRVTGAWLCAAALHRPLCGWTLAFCLWLLQAPSSSVAKGLLQLPYWDSVSLTIVVPTIKKTHKNETKHLGSSHSLDRLLPFFLPAEGNLRAEAFSFPLSTVFSCQLCWFFSCLPDLKLNEKTVFANALWRNTELDVSFQEKEYSPQMFDLYSSSKFPLL